MSPPVDVYLFHAPEHSKYVPLIFTGIEERYRRHLGRPAAFLEAIKHRQNGEPAIVHVMWEEAHLASCSSDAEAAAVARRCEDRLASLISLGGRVVQTIHNGWPHRVDFRDAFVRIRQASADAASAILVHNEASAEFLRRQIAFDERKLVLFPHPSYVGTYEREVDTLAGLGSATDRSILLFGEMRQQKGFGPAIETLDSDFLRSLDAHVRVSGAGNFAEQLSDGAAHRSDIRWDIRYVPDAEAGSLMRAASCVLLPYEQFLTSGIAHLILSLGGIMVAPDEQQHRQLVPEPNHRFLYRAGEDADMRRAVASALGLGPADRQAARRLNFERARELSPADAGRALSAIYDRSLSGLRP